MLFLFLLLFLRGCPAALLLSDKYDKCFFFITIFFFNSYFLASPRKKKKPVT